MISTFSGSISTLTSLTEVNPYDVKVFKEL